MLKYKRISLKLSGEAMGGAQAVDFDKAEAIARQVARLHELGAEIGITIGGGNIWRGRSSGDMDRNRADQMGHKLSCRSGLPAEAGDPCRGDVLNRYAKNSG